MRARSLITVERRDGRDRLVDVRCEPPLTVRQCHDRILLVGSTAAPVGGDELHTDVHVGAGASARVGSAAATLVWPGPRGESSSTSTSIVVAERAHLDWRPEPVVSVTGSVHRASTTLDLDATASCRFVEEVALGRHDEPAGDLELFVRVRRSGRTLLAHTERFGANSPGAGSLAAVADAGHVVCAVLVGASSHGDQWRGDRSVAIGDSVSSAAATLPIADDATVVLAVGVDRLDAWRFVALVAPALANAGSPIDPQRPLPTG
ncbi:MAG: urease accessory protein UreD [Actinomycetota bacterium]